MPYPQDQDETPHGPTPPTPPPARPGRYISSRLREKIESVEEEPEKPLGGGGPPWGPIIGGLLVVALAIAGFMWWRSNQARNATAAQEAVPSPSPVAAAADTADTAATAALPSPSPTPPAASPRPAPPSATAAKPKATPAPAAPRAYAIVVGTYMFEDKAKENLDQVAASSGMTGRVVPADEGGTTVYQVVLGDFSSRSAAETKAAELLGSGAREARVITRPR
jgi:cytoskeletal protein RodZ